MSEPNSAPEPKLSVIEDASSSQEASSSTADADMATQESEGFLAFSVKYGRSVLSVRLGEHDTVSDLKAILYSMTDVPPSSQKLIGLTRGKPPADDALVGQMQFPPTALKSRSKNTAQAEESLGEVKLHVAFMLLGTPEADRFQDPTGTAKSSEDLAEAVVDVDYSQPAARKEKMPKPAEDPKNLRKLQKVVDRFSGFSVMNEPRPGKNLLVLDLDYTLADTKRLLDPASLASQAARPGLLDFLAAVYPDYDICIWSQTSWRWLEVKLIELNMIGHPDFNISFVLDRTPMFSIKTEERSHEVKPLELIWRRWPEFYGAHNTIHVDDLSRNFAMNPKNGLKIKPYKHSPNFDTELQAVKRYLLQLAHDSVTDFTQIDHKHWKHYVGPEKGSAPPPS